MKMKQYYAVKKFTSDEDCEMLFGPATYEEVWDFLAMNYPTANPKTHFVVAQLIEVD